jgi:hypothetical protein
MNPKDFVGYKRDLAGEAHKVGSDPLGQDRMN